MIFDFLFFQQNSFQNHVFTNLKKIMFKIQTLFSSKKFKFSILNLPVRFRRPILVLKKATRKNKNISCVVEVPYNIWTELSFFMMLHVRQHRRKDSEGWKKCHQENFRVLRAMRISAKTTMKIYDFVRYHKFGLNHKISDFSWQMKFQKMQIWY